MTVTTIITLLYVCFRTGRCQLVRLHEISREQTVDYTLLFLCTHDPREPVKSVIFHFHALVSVGRQSDSLWQCAAAPCRQIMHLLGGLT